MELTKLELTDYQIIKQIYESPHVQVYRAIDNRNQTPVILKILRDRYPSFNELLRFKNQYTIAKNLNLPGIVTPIALERNKNSYVLVMEDIGGISLSEYSAKGQINLPLFFTVAIALSEILEGLYRERVIHKDIKPSNILINPETLEVKLIDFSISSRLPKENQIIQNLNLLEGTLAYISPEQTGRTNRGIDYRSDFYSLGITFYELLTGTLPFPTTDAIELVHCHLAQTPIPPHEIKPEIPPLISQIVLKLMAKTPEERYQSAGGLKYDFQTCRQQWETNGTIAEFPLGTRDISDRFQITEKLYGREAEIATLLAAFDRVAGQETEKAKSELILVAGFSGIGKTALINEIHKPILRQRGYFIKGKFDQFQRNIPLSAFVMALRDLMGQLLAESASSVAEWKGKILAAVGEQGQIIIDVVPELELLIGKQPAVAELAPEAAQNRFERVFSKFVRAIATPTHPLVIFLDDLQWADRASLKLLALLMSEAERGYLLLIGAYRDNEVSPAHPLMLTLEEIRHNTLINIVTLQPLGIESLNHLIADTLKCSPPQAQELTRSVFRKTKGNPFFATQFLKYLHQEGLISFDYQNCSWQCAIAKIKTLSLTDDVVEFMALQLQQLPETTREILKLAACVGNQFDLATLALISEKSLGAVAIALEEGLQASLILPINQVYKFFSSSNQEEKSLREEELSKGLSVAYKFLHDRVQQAAESLIPQDKKRETRWRIGRLLLKNTPPEQLEEKIFDIADRLNYGVDLIESASDRDELARLNLKAGSKAKAATAHQAAADYFAAVQKLLPPDSWQREYYFTLELYQEAAEAAYLNGDFEEMERAIATVWQKAKTLLDRVKVIEVQIQAAIARNQLMGAIEIALPILKQVGVEFPSQPSSSDIELGLAKTQEKLKGKQPSKLLQLPRMTDQNSLAAMRILASVIPATFKAMPALFPLIVFKQIDLSLEDGNAPLSSFTYACYGLLLCSGMGDIEVGYQFGQIALELLDKLNATELKAQTTHVVNTYIKPWKEPVKDTLKPLLETYACALETGALEYAAYAIFIYSYYSYFSGRELEGLAREMEGYRNQIIKLKQEATLNLHLPYQQAVLNLLGRAENQFVLTGEVYDEESIVPQLIDANNREAVCYFCLNKAILYYLFGKYREAIDYSNLAEKDLAGALPVAILNFYDSLARLMVYAGANLAEKQEIIERVNANQEKMKQWADFAPMNFLHKYLLVEAEKARVLGEKLEAIELYDCAIELARKNKYYQEEAIANELAAKFYQSWGKETISNAYITQAYYGYAHWGAGAKILDLEAKYPQLLTQSLLGRKTQKTSCLAATLPPTTTTQTNSKATLDLATLMKASQAIAGEIVLEKLLAKLMKIILENAGAQVGYLLLELEDKMLIEARGDLDSKEISVLESIPIDNYLPVSVINYVAHSRETVVLNDAFQEGKFGCDPYIQSQKTQSILCAPLLNQCQLSGIVYLENNLVQGAFTPDRLELLQMLSSQAAIAIDNARIYEHLEQKVSQRTAELAKTIERLKTTQKQLVESEKMAALGGLVAGVAHEINTPVGNGLMAASTLLESSQEFSEIYLGGKMKRSQLEDFLETAIDSSDLIFNNLQRAAELINSFKQVAVDRTSETKRKFKLKKYLGEIVISLTPQLRKNPHQIKIIGDENLSLDSYPGALSQIVTNLILNSIIHGYSKGEIGTLTFEFYAQGEDIILLYRDDGGGIPPENIGKIFDPFFTTKRGEGGCGLGLHVAYNLVSQKMGGTIECESKQGVGSTFTIKLPYKIEYREKGEKNP